MTTCKTLAATLITAASFLAPFAALTTHSRCLAQGGQQSPIPGSEIDNLVAPIALYPDALVAQILLCAQTPFEVKQVASWVNSHPELKGSQAQSAAEQEGFDACFIALVPFPQVLDMMAGQMDWTTRLGQAFTADKNNVFNSIQRLRAQAKAAGNLQSTDQQEVVVQQSNSGQQVIVIQPANPQIVYVPVYNTATVYTQPAPTSGQVAGAAAIGFAAGIIVGAAINDNDHYSYSYGWGYHGGGCCSAEGWNNYANYRSDMATQRQNAVSSNQSARQSQSATNQANRQDAASSNQAARQNAAGSTQATASSNQAARQSSAASAQSTATANQAARQSTASSGAAASQSNQANRQAAASGSAGSRSGSGMSYENGSQARSASSRGQSSMSSRSGGGGSRGGGGRR